LREKNDFYPTEATLTNLLICKLAPRIPCRAINKQTIMDCCSGDGAILKALELGMPWVDRISNEPYHWDAGMADFQGEAQHRSIWLDFPPIDWVITNPPYDKKVLTPILANAWEFSREGVAALLRITYLEPCGDRAAFLEQTTDHLRYVIPVNPRPRFRSDSKGTDSTTVAWFVWDKHWSWSRHEIDPPFHFASNWR
jgi:hypothetical protein